MSGFNYEVKIEDKCEVKTEAYEEVPFGEGSNGATGGLDTSYIAKVKTDDSIESIPVKTETYEEVPFSEGPNGTTDELNTSNIAKVKTEDSIDSIPLTSFTGSDSEQRNKLILAVPEVKEKLQRSVPYEEKPFSCQFCSYTTKHITHLRRHILIHAEKKPFSCGLSPYEGCRKNDLQGNIWTPTIKTTFYCGFCSYTTRDNGHLQTHILLHAGELPFSCKLCPFKALRISNLNRHMLNHSGVRHFSCEVCSYKARSISLLKEHFIMHTRKQFACKLCTYKTQHEGHWRDHIMTHTAEKTFSCKFCTYKTWYKCNLKDHIMIHTGEKPFSCEMCSYKARRRSNLLGHILIHNRVKSFSCKLCPYKAQQKGSLQKHILKHSIHPSGRMDSGERESPDRQQATTSKTTLRVPQEINVAPGPGVRSFLHGGRPSSLRYLNKATWSRDEKMAIVECREYSSYEEWVGYKGKKMLERLQGYIDQAKLNGVTINTVFSMFGNVKRFLTAEEIERARTKGRRAAEQDYKNLTVEEKSKMAKERWTNEEKWKVVWSYEYAKVRNNQRKKMIKEWRELHAQLNPQKNDTEPKKLEVIRRKAVTSGFIKQHFLQMLREQAKDMLRQGVMPSVAEVMKTFPGKQAEARRVVYVLMGKLRKSRG